MLSEDVVEQFVTQRPVTGARRLLMAMLLDALAELAVSHDASARRAALTYLCDPDDHGWPLSTAAICRALDLAPDSVSAYAVLLASSDPAHRRAMAESLRALVPHRVAAPSGTVPRLVTRPCPTCGADYTTPYPQKLTCSPACAATFERTSHAEKRGRAARSTRQRPRATLPNPRSVLTAP